MNKKEDLEMMLKKHGLKLKNPGVSEWSFEHHKSSMYLLIKKGQIENLKNMYENFLEGK